MGLCQVISLLVLTVPVPEEPTALVQDSTGQSFTGQSNLLDGSLKPCTTSSDSGATGVFRSGSCEWTAEDSGYHEVCVEVSEKFLKSSASNDGNDLTSVVKPGGHWCICAWAWASAVERDPANKQDLKLQCEATNGKLREVYESYDNLDSPSGQRYESKAALKAVDQLCPNGGGDL